MECPLDAYPSIVCADESDTCRCSDISHSPYRPTIRRGRKRFAPPERRTHVQASLRDLVTTGQLGGIGLGASRALIAEALGEPDQYLLNSRSRQRKRLPPAAWKYGDIELYFADTTDQVELIYLAHFTLPSGGPKLQLDPWIFRHTLRLAALQQILEREHIRCRAYCEPYDDPETQRLRAGVGVDFLFTITPTAYGPPVGLTVIEYRHFKGDSTY